MCQGQSQHLMATQIYNPSCLHIGLKNMHPWAMQALLWSALVDLPRHRVKHFALDAGEREDWQINQHDDEHTEEREAHGVARPCIKP